MGGEQHQLTREEAVAEESKRIRRLQLTVGLVMNLISQGNLPFE